MFSFMELSQLLHFIWVVLLTHTKWFPSLCKANGLQDPTLPVWVQVDIGDSSHMTVFFSVLQLVCFSLVNRTFSLSLSLAQLLLYWLGTSWKVKFFYAFLLTSGASVETRAQFSRGSCCVPPTHQTPIFSHILSTQQRSGLGQIFLENTFTERGFNLGLKLGIMCTFWDYMHFPERGSRYSPHSQRLPNKQTNK